MQDLELGGDLRDGDRVRGVHVADQEVDLVALDQLARLLHRDVGLVRGRILDHQLDLPAEDAALGVGLLGRQLHAGHLVLAERGVDAGEGIIHPDLDRLLAARLDDVGRRELRGAERQAGLEQRAPAESAVGRFLSHGFLPQCFLRLCLAFQILPYIAASLPEFGKPGKPSERLIWSTPGSIRARIVAPPVNAQMPARRKSEAFERLRSGSSCASGTRGRRARVRARHSKRRAGGVSL